MKKFEYQIISSQWGMDKATLNKWGGDGWELCTIIDKEKFSTFKYIFKKQIVT